MCFCLDLYLCCNFIPCQKEDKWFFGLFTTSLRKILNMSRTWNCCSSKLGEFLLIIAKRKTQPNILLGNLSWRELGLFTYCYSALLWKVWNHRDEKNFISCFEESNKFRVGFINSKYKAEVCIIVLSIMGEIRLVGRIHTGEGWSEAHGFKQIGVELQGSLFHLKEDLRCNLSNKLLSYAVLCFSNN